MSSTIQSMVRSRDFITRKVTMMSTDVEQLVARRTTRTQQTHHKSAASAPAPPTHHGPLPDPPRGGAGTRASAEPRDDLGDGGDGGAPRPPARRRRPLPRALRRDGRRRQRHVLGRPCELRPGWVLRLGRRAREQGERRRPAGGRGRAARGHERAARGDGRGSIRFGSVRFGSLARAALRARAAVVCDASSWWCGERRGSHSLAHDQFTVRDVMSRVSFFRSRSRCSRNSSRPSTTRSRRALSSSRPPSRSA